MKEKLNYDLMLENAYKVLFDVNASLNLQAHAIITVSIINKLRNSVSPSIPVREIKEIIRAAYHGVK